VADSSMNHSSPAVSFWFTRTGEVHPLLVEVGFQPGVTGTNGTEDPIEMLALTREVTEERVARVFVDQGEPGAFDDRHECASAMKPQRGDRTVGDSERITHETPPLSRCSARFATSLTREP